MKSSKIVVKSLEITTRNPCPDSLIEYHIEPLTGNKKPAEHRQPMANAKILIKDFALFGFFSLCRVVSFFSLELLLLDLPVIYPG